MTCITDIIERLLSHPAPPTHILAVGVSRACLPVVREPHTEVMAQGDPGADDQALVVEPSQDANDLGRRDVELPGGSQGCLQLVW